MSHGTDRCAAEHVNVLVNLTWLVPGVVGGSEESTTASLRALLEHRSDFTLSLAVLRSFASAHPDLAEACRCEVLDIDGSNKVARVWAEQRWLADRTRAGGVDVVHHAGGVVPLVHPGANVVTIHDLQPLDLPANFGVAKRWYSRAMIGRSASAAEIVCVPSEFTAARVRERLGTDGSKVRVVPWSVSEAGANPIGTSDPVDPSRPVFLYPAITYPHKNHLLLLEAFAGLLDRVPEAELLLPGGSGPLEAEVVERISRSDLRGRVSRPGRVAEADLDGMYRRATAVLIPSEYEGFGLPALEAMSRGVPVVVADSGALPEVVGRSGLPPVGRGSNGGIGSEWTAAMLQVTELDADQRGRLVDRQYTEASRFTPGRTADSMADAYLDAIQRATATTTPPTPSV